MLPHATGVSARPENNANNFWQSRADSPHNGGEASTAEAVAQFLTRLVEADMTASGYRVVLDTVARLLRQERMSEAVPSQWVADRLGVHRNAVSAAYKDAERHGLLRRVAVLTRGAPTRTSLAGPALGVATRLAALRLPTTDAPTFRPAVGWPAAGHQEAAHHNSRANVKASNARVRNAPKNADDVQPQKPNVSQSPVAPATEVCPAVPPAAYEPQLPEPQGRAAEHPRASAEDHVSLRAKIGADALYAVMSHTPGTQFTPLKAWNLTQGEIDALHELLPKCEKTTRTPPATARHPAAPATSGSKAHPAAAKTLMSALPVIAKKLGETRAGQVIDEIAYMVAVKGLGRGDHAGGARAGISLVQRGLWSTPRGMDSSWRGAVLRAACDAPKSVH